MKILVTLVLLLAPSLAHAAVAESTSASFRVTEELEIAKSPREVWAALGKVDRWWSSDHSWSGASANMSLVMSAGGCFCEKWADRESKLPQSVAHGMVIASRPPSLLRLEAALGPLQSMALKGVLDFELVANDKGTKLKVTYLVRGDASANLDQIAPAVDQVLSEQGFRLKTFAETGHLPGENSPRKPEPAATATLPPVVR